MNKSFRIAVPLLEFLKAMERSWNAPKRSGSGTHLNAFLVRDLTAIVPSLFRWNGTQIVPRSKPLVKRLVERSPSCKAATLNAAASQSAWHAIGSERKDKNRKRRHASIKRRHASILISLIDDFRVVGHRLLCPQFPANPLKTILIEIRVSVVCPFYGAF